MTAVLFVPAVGWLVVVDHHVVHLDAEAGRQFVFHLPDEAAGLTFAHSFALGTVDKVHLFGAEQKMVEVVGVDRVFLLVGGEPELPFELEGYQRGGAA